MDYQVIDLPGETDHAVFIREAHGRRRVGGPTECSGYFAIERALVDGSLPPAVDAASDHDALTYAEWDFLPLAYRSASGHAGCWAGRDAVRRLGYPSAENAVDFCHLERLGFISDVSAADNGRVRYGLMMCPVMKRTGLVAAADRWHPLKAAVLGRAYFRVPNSIVQRGSLYFRSRSHHIRRLMILTYALLDEEIGMISPLHLAYDHDGGRLFASDLLLEGYPFGAEDLKRDLGYLLDSGFIHLRPATAEMVAPYLGRTHALALASADRNDPVCGFSPNTVPPTSGVR